MSIILHSVSNWLRSWSQSLVLSLSLAPARCANHNYQGHKLLASIFSPPLNSITTTRRALSVHDTSLCIAAAAGTDWGDNGIGIGLLKTILCALPRIRSQTDRGALKYIYGSRLRFICSAHKVTQRMTRAWLLCLAVKEGPLCDLSPKCIFRKIPWTRHSSQYNSTRGRQCTKYGTSGPVEKSNQLNARPQIGVTIMRINRDTLTNGALRWNVKRVKLYTC